MNKQGYKAVVVSLCLISAMQMLAVTAEASSPPKGEFAKIKENQLNKLDNRIAILKSEMACIQAAATIGELQACRDKAKAELKKLRADQ